MSRTVLQIEGMSCGHCVMTITKALKNLKGVSDVNVSLDEKKAVVDHPLESAPSVTEMINAVEEEGYSARISG